MEWKQERRCVCGLVSAEQSHYGVLLFHILAAFFFLLLSANDPAVPEALLCPRRGCCATLARFCHASGLPGGPVKATTTQRCPADDFNRYGES